MDTTQNRKRSNALHAETSEEYLKKLEWEDTKKPCPQKSQKSNSYDNINRVFDFDFEFDFDGIPEQPPEEELLDLPTEQQYHRILVIQDDFKLSHRKINQFIENPYQNDGLTNSTNDEVKPFLGDSDCVLPLDIYLLKRIEGSKQHIFQFWIQNSHNNPVINIFEETYYQKFDSFVHCMQEGIMNKNIERIKAKLRPEAQLFILTKNEFCMSPSKKVKMTDSASSQLSNCSSFIEVMEKLIN